MNDLTKLSVDLQNSIFEYDIDKFNKQVIELINLLSQNIEDSISENEQDKIFLIRKIIDKINIAFCNKDYLLFADMLKYELEINL